LAGGAILCGGVTSAALLYEGLQGYILVALWNDEPPDVTYIRKTDAVTECGWRLGVQWLVIYALHYTGNQPGMRRCSLNCTGLQEEEQRKDENLKFLIHCSFLEIYKEEMTDLLELTSTNLPVLHLPLGSDEICTRGFFVPSFHKILVMIFCSCVRMYENGCTWIICPRWRRTVFKMRFSCLARSRPHQLFSRTPLPEGSVGWICDRFRSSRSAHGDPPLCVAGIGEQESGSHEPEQNRESSLMVGSHVSSKADGSVTRWLHRDWEDWISFGFEQALEF
jgi:hypothetical protein